MTRKIHEKDICEITDKGIQDILDEHLSGEKLVIAAEDNRLQQLIPINGQTSLGNQNDYLEFGDDATIFTAPFDHKDRDCDIRLPKRKTERFHFQSNSYDTAVTVFSKAEHFNRLIPFRDLTRIVRPGGTILSITGLLPDKHPYHDAKWWVPQSDDAPIDAIKILRYEDYKTPIIVSKFTVNSSCERYPDATITTQ